MKNIKSSLTLIAAVFLMSACSKSGPSAASGSGSHNVKFTVTVAGGVPATYRGLINLVFNSATANQTIWTVNNVQQTNQTVLTFDGTTFPQGTTTTLVIQSVIPLKDTNVHLDFGNLASLPTYSISYKAEIDGKVQNDDENVTISGTTSYQHNYSY